MSLRASVDSNMSTFPACKDGSEQGSEHKELNERTKWKKDLARAIHRPVEAAETLDTNGISEGL